MIAITRSTAPVLAGAYTLNGRLTRLFDDAFRGWPFVQEEGGAPEAARVPPVDVSEDRDAVQIVAELPGVKPEDVKISLENDLLTIRGEKHQTADEKADRAHRDERTYGAFVRTFTVPSTVDAEHVQATYDLGVLTVRLPKLERAKPRQIEVKVKDRV
ncbi:MAG TPA: Hsp20/alpha crystallin family protein [Gemmatimonadales bacterium]|nr:Hsp20/alpha crystallin family protein [Gemmatimonadales bacterium]